MKKVALAAALALTTSTAFAGGYEAPVMEPQIVVEETASSSAPGLVVALLVLAVAAAAIAR
ncbi:hypothetical protein [Anianabacter salinae]|uniref:hypothetical protein n=1 Tax=Anianabacter salinae TaxID=2851023 RepID=UPI00225E372F|nr:hypothetical protein [Anianabacter salinae]MBV0913547.1 hypothetical protein [Anianabacter salinae]